jgi:hypothetical protein
MFSSFLSETRPARAAHRCAIGTRVPACATIPPSAPSSMLVASVDEARCHTALTPLAAKELSASTSRSLPSTLPIATYAYDGKCDEDCPTGACRASCSQSSRSRCPSWHGPGIRLGGAAGRTSTTAAQFEHKSNNRRDRQQESDGTTHTTPRTRNARRHARDRQLQAPRSLLQASSRRPHPLAFVSPISALHRVITRRDELVSSIPSVDEKEQHHQGRNERRAEGAHRAERARDHRQSRTLGSRHRIEQRLQTTLESHARVRTCMPPY